ncbi:MAG: PDZ domain-containing protein, partial [Patescibacteria group bacterium]|nr:PDZ domain-containing protein [Patescibacteria group bacterium]
MWKRVWSGMLAAVLATAGNVWADVAASDAPQGEKPPRREQKDRPAAKPARPGQGPAVELGEFWLGLECYPAPPPLVEQLDLSEDGGLLVGHVIAGSPAEAAGLKQHDVL